MKKIVLLISFSLALALNQVNGQGVTADINPLTLPCGGGQVNLTALGNSITPVFGDNFNNGGLQPGWSTNVTADFSNPCGASVDGSTYLWVGSSAAAPRAISSAPVNVSCGGTVCFDFKFVCESCGDSAPCEGEDQYDEGDVYNILQMVEQLG